jgi:hypothetical protein
MTEVSWPPPNPAADRLLASYLNLVSPAWQVMKLGPVVAKDILPGLWELATALRADRVDRADPMGEPEADKMIAALAEGAEIDLQTLSAAARGVLHARVLLVLSGLALRTLDPDPVMRLPRGLSPDQLGRAAAIRLLFQAPLSTAGLD